MAPTQSNPKQTAAIDVTSQLQYLDHVSCRGTLTDTTCDITITLGDNQQRGSLAKIDIKNSEPSIVTAVKQLVHGLHTNDPQSHDELATVLRLSSLATQSPNSDGLHHIVASDTLHSVIIETYKQARKDIGFDCPNTDLAWRIVGALKTLHSCYPANENFEDLFEETVRFTEDFAAEIRTENEGDWEPAFQILGPLAATRLILDLYESPHSQPPIHTRMIHGFSGYCDTNNPDHIRILGRLMARSIHHEDSDDWADDKIDSLISNLDVNDSPPSLTLDQYRVAVYQGLIEGGIDKLRAVPVEWSSRALPKLARGLNDGGNIASRLFNAPCLLDAFTHIPEDVVLAGLKNCPVSTVEECLRRWDNLDATSHGHIVDAIERDKAILSKIEWDNLNLPREIQPIFYDEAFFDTIWDNELLRSQFVIYVEAFPNLPEHILLKFIGDGHLGEVLLHRRCFEWSNRSKNALLESLIKENRIEPIIENLDFFPERLLKRLRNEHPALLTFKNETKLREPNLYKIYQEQFAQNESTAKALLVKAHDILEASVTPEEIPDKYRSDPLYPMIFAYAYPGATFEKIAQAEDRSEDLDLFEVPPKQNLNLLAGKTMILKKGIEPDSSLLNRLQRYIQTPQRIIENTPESAQELQNAFDDTIQGSFSDISGSSTEEKILAAIELASENPRKGKACRRLAVLYHALREQNFRDYASDSQDRVDQAPNREYAYLLELREFLETVVPDSVKKAIDTIPDRSTRDRFRGCLSALFEEDLRLIDLEINKYTPEGESTNSIPSISAFITKCSQSAGMAFSAGVCVAGDVPRPGLKHAGDNMWQTENYFNLVFRDEETKRCVGGVLLHYYEEENKRILSASINPSSSLLYRVDEQRFFDETMRILQEFAEQNDIDMIATSQDSGIRTNRTGGMFEQALTARIREVNEQFSLPYKEIFSFDPEYYVKDLDVLWKRS